MDSIYEKNVAIENIQAIYSESVRKLYVHLLFPRQFVFAYI